MAPKHILITGGAGFIGSHLTDRLLNEGYRVTVLDNLDPYYEPEIKRANVAMFENHPAYVFQAGDVTRPDDLLELKSAPFNAIVHLAARVGVRASLTDPASYIRANVLGTQTLLEYARENLKGNFVFASSSSVYGDRKDGPFKESDPTDQPMTVYAASKKSGEMLCHAYHKLYGTRAICLRFFTVYGPRQRPEMAIAKFAQLIATNQPLPLLGDSNSSRDYTYVEDTCAGIVGALKSKIKFGIYNLGCGSPVSLGEMVDALGKALHKKPRIDPLPRADGDVFLTHADIRHAMADLQYEPKVSFREGIRRYVASLKKNS